MYAAKTAFFFVRISGQARFFLWSSASALNMSDSLHFKSIVRHKYSTADSNEV